MKNGRAPARPFFSSLRLPCYSGPVNPVALSAFVDELEKIGAAAGLSTVSKARTGVKPISIQNLIKKHNEGSWLKKADSAGSPADVRGDSVDDPGAAPLPKRRGEVPTKDPGNIPQSEKTGQVPGANTQTPAFTSGEDMTAGNSRLRQRGEVPSQDNISVGSPNNRITPGPGRLGPVITNDVSAKRPRKGDTPTSDRDMNIVDRSDLRESATTVTGLGQSSTGIGAFNSPAEHT